MKTQRFKKGDEIMRQGERSTQMHTIARGSVRRLREDQYGHVHIVDNNACGATLGSLHLIKEDPCYATAVAVSPKVETYSLDSTTLRKLIVSDSTLALEVIDSLSKEIRSVTKKLRTPLLDLQARKTHVTSICAAAGIESFYRSALNSLINQRLTGVKAPLFPDMHIQVPVRMVYFSGLKGIRKYLQDIEATEILTEEVMETFFFSSTI